MSKNAYEVLGVKPDSNETEIDEAYYNLRSQYRNDMYQEGAAGKTAAKKLTELEQAYQSILQERNAASASQNTEQEVQAVASDGTSKSNHSAAFALVEKYIKAKDFKSAQEALDNVGVRDGEWHYFQAVIYYNKGWMSEAKNQMEMACNMDPSNAHYREVLTKLDNAINNASHQHGAGNQGQSRQYNGYQRSYSEQDARQSEDMCCRWCQTMICLNCLCDCCCRG